MILTHVLEGLSLVLLVTAAAACCARAFITREPAWMLAALAISAFYLVWLGRLFWRWLS